MHHLYCSVFGCRHLRLGASLYCAKHQPPDPDDTPVDDDRDVA